MLQLIEKVLQHDLRALQWVKKALTLQTWARGPPSPQQPRSLTAFWRPQHPLRFEDVLRTESPRSFPNRAPAVNEDNAPCDS